MDESLSGQLQLDFVTGQPTALGGSSPDVVERAACSALNRSRARGILETYKFAPPGQSFPVDVWHAAFARRTREWRVPLISLTKLGFGREDEGLHPPESFSALKPGAEAEPYLHRNSGIVYKFFNLRAGGALGKKISFEPAGEEGYQLRHGDATLVDTLEKIQVLHDMGAHPTEIVGLSDMGDFLIVKQPFAVAQVYNTDGRPEPSAYQTYESDRAAAIASIKGDICHGPGLREAVVVSWLSGHPWLVADLHHRNIMRDQYGVPTIIDALIGPVTPAAHENLRWLADHVAYARRWREEGERPRRVSWGDDVDDASL